MSFWGRRLIYLVFAIALAIPLLTHWKVPPDVGPEARAFYDAVERVPENKIVVINCQFEAGTIGENGPQTSAMVAHLLQANKRFAFIGLDPVGPGLCQEIAEAQAKRINGENPGNPPKKYGESWANWGYKLGLPQVIKGIARDIPGSISKDFQGRPISQLPVMNGIKTASDVGLLVDITPSATYAFWISFFTQPFNVPFAVAPTSVMIADIYPYMNSGQVVGMLKGIAGAAQYEKLVGFEGEGHTNRMPVFMAHVTIIMLILVGNFIEIRQRKAARP